jgi:hypothetical protein
VELVCKNHPQTTVFSFEGEGADKSAERVRSGIYGYASDHPDLLPEGTCLRMAVRPHDEVANAWQVFGWLEDIPEELTPLDTGI